MTWGQAVVFAGYSGFLHYLQLASHELAIIGINVMKNKILNSKFSADHLCQTEPIFIVEISILKPANFLKPPGQC